MKKFEVRKIEVEVDKKKARRGITAEETFYNKIDQDTELIRAFDTLDEARAFYEQLGTSCRELSAGGCRYFLHVGKCIEVNEYDEDGEQLGGGEWEAADFAEHKDEDEDEDEDEEGEE